MTQGAWTQGTFPTMCKAFGPMYLGRSLDSGRCNAPIVIDAACVLAILKRKWHVGLYLASNESRRISISNTFCALRFPYRALLSLDGIVQRERGSKTPACNDNIRVSVAVSSVEAIKFIYFVVLHSHILLQCSQSVDRLSTKQNGISVHFDTYISIRPFDLM